MRQLWVSVVLLVGGCEIPDDVKVQMACTTVCTCFGGGLSVETCTDACVDDGEFRALPEDCFECIQAHANQCKSLESDCEPVCARSEPPNEDLPDGGIRE